MSSKQLYLVLAMLGSLAGSISTPTPPSFSSSASPQASNGPWRAPADGPATDLDEVLNGQNAPGIYSPSFTPDIQYGTYNWCNRTPYASNTFFKEDIAWNCTDEGPYAYGRSSTGLKSSSVYWQAQRGSQNPFEQTVGPGFLGSNCVFPAITSQGLDDAKQHGMDIRGVYGDLLQFLPHSDEDEKYAFRVTNNVITSQTLGATIQGLFPNLREHSAWIQVSIITCIYSSQQSAAYDSLEPSISCPAASALNKQYEGTNPAWLDHLTRSAGLGARFNAVSGIQDGDTAGWNTSWDHPYDNLSAKQCHGKPLPCSVNDTSICVSQSDANAIYRLGQYEYAYRWRLAPQSLQYSALKMGAWFTELLGHLRAARDGTSSIKYFHNFAHDGSLAPVLGLLQINKPIWPGMGTEVVFELWKKNNAWYIRVLFNGQPLQTSTDLGVLDMIKFDDFEEYLRSVIPADLVAACRSQ